MLITHARLVNWDEPIQINDDQAIHIQDGRITDLGDTRILTLKYPSSDQIDAGGQLLMPGLICAHTHFYGAFARGMNIPGKAPANFLEILQKLWWPLDQALTADDVRLSALVCLIDAVRHGTTTLIDHHASPHALEGSLEVIADAVEQAGVRAALCYEVTDRYGPALTRLAIEENLHFLNSERVRKNELLAGLFGLHASLTLSEETLAACREAAPEGTGFHTHLAEAEADQLDSVKKYGMRVTERLHRHELLGASSIAVHAVHVGAGEIARLAHNKTWVTHQPRSNMNNAVGTAPVEKMLAAGVRMALGNDGFSNAMWEEWKCAYLVHKLDRADPRQMNGNTVIDIAVRNNAELACSLFPASRPGRLAVGNAADLILVDYQPTTPLTGGNLPWHSLFGFRDGMVTGTMVNGKWLMRDRQLLTLDELAITAQARQQAQQTWKRYAEFAEQGAYHE